MRSALTALTALVAAGCSGGGDSVEAFASDRQAAETTVAACEAGRHTRDCDAAREGLAGAKRRDREILYRQAL